MTMIPMLLYGSLILMTNRFFLIAESCTSIYYPLTKCIDKLDHYQCLCGQGQSWNGFSCVVDAVDSRLVFNGTRVPSYIELSSKTFPRVSELTISFWVRFWPKSDGSQHTIIFYRTDDVSSALLVSLTESGWLRIEILNNVYYPSIPLIAEKWNHVAIAHHLSRSEQIKVMVNGTSAVVRIEQNSMREERRTRLHMLDGGGDLFVGQALASTSNTSGTTIGELEFDSHRAFHGEITFMNIWQKMLSDNELQQLAIDCHVQKQECGDAIAWMDFVNDIKGEIRIHWPSGIYSLFSNCPTDKWLRESCNSYCRRLEGPHCKNESHLSIIWQKAMAGQTIVQECPGHVKNGSVYRTCEKIEKIARWTNVDYSECTHPLVNTIDQELNGLVSTAADMFTVREKSALLAEITKMNVTLTELYSSVDLVLLIEQIERLTKVLTSHFDSLVQWYSITGPTIYLDDVNVTLSIYKNLLMAISNLADARYESIWTDTNPIGNDFLRLITSLQRLTNIVSQVLTKDCRKYPGCSFTTQTDNIDQTVHVVNRQQLETFSYEDSQAKIKINIGFNKKTMPFNRTYFHHDERDNISNTYSIVVTTFRTAHLFIPNLRLGRISKYDNLNTYVVSIDVKLRKPVHRSENLVKLIPCDSIPMTVTLGYLKFDNISGNRCVFLNTDESFKSEEYKPALYRQWVWQNSPSICNMSTQSPDDRGICHCFIPEGIFGITSDMFDPDWRPLELRVRPLDIFSYIGSCIHVCFALFTLLMLSYLQTRSSAAYIHKHYSFTLCCSQILLVFAFNGVPHYNSLLCRAVACLTHFFILASYCWLMNEAFNLYIQITYTTHPAVAGASTALSDAASKYRFLGMGYILPFCIVTLLASIKKSTYFMPPKSCLCFIDLDDWFKTYFIPITAIIFITIMVMIFSAKQHHESSYTKNEKANEVIVTYTGGIWSQLFLITVTWSLAILPYFYDETILRLLHGFFNSLQGGFLFLSFFMFNDEIRRHYRDRRRQLRRIQLMELPYRSSIGASEERGSTILIPSISPQVVNEENASNSMNPPQKVTSFSATVSLLLNRSRQASLKRQGSTDSKVFTQRQISKTIEIQQDQYADDEDDTDCRVSVV